MGALEGRGVAIAERQLAILVTAKDLATRKLQGLNRELDKTGRKIGGIAAKGIGTSIKNLGKLAIAGAGVSLVLGVGAVKAAADFESQLNTINTVAAATPERLQEIGAGIRKIARDTGTPLEELTQGFYDLVSAGVAASQAQRVLESSNRLAIGGISSAAEGVDLLTTALNSYGVSADKQGQESERFADIFAKSIERGKVTAAELAASFAQVGGIAATSGIEIEELAASYAQLTAKGTTASVAATQIRAAILALVRRTGDLKKLEKQTGKSYLAIAGERGLVSAFEELRVDAEKSKVPLINVLGPVEALAFAVGTTGAEFDAYNAHLDAMGDSAGTAARQMSARQQGLNHQLTLLKSLARDVGITIGSKLLPKLTPLAKRLVDFLSEKAESGDLDTLGDNLAGAFDRAAAFAERIPWESIGSGLKVAAEWSGRLLELFMNLPPQAQATIVALAGLNKLSGGAISGIVGELGKGLIKGVLGMNAGVVNLRAGVVNGGVGAGGAAAAAKGGGVLGKAGMALGVAGMAIGAVTIVNAVREGIAEGVAEQGAGAAATGRDFLSSSPTFRELNSSIAGIDKGIADLQAVPLGFLLGADKQVAELQKLRSEFAAQRDMRFQQPARISNEVNVPVSVVVNTDVNVSGGQRVTYLSSRANRTARKTVTSTPISGWTNPWGSGFNWGEG